MNVNGIETERRFLIRRPSPELLAGLTADAIEQIYIDSDSGGTARVRARSRDGLVTYTHTVKKRLSAISAREDEREISAEEFELLAKTQEKGTSPIRKTRYLLPYRGLIFEIDVYAEWRGVAIMEVELPAETAEVTTPPGIDIIKEVSGDHRLSNHSLSRRFPDEEELTAEI